MKRILLILSPVILATLAFAGLLNYFHPQIENFLIHQIRSVSHRFTPVEMTAEHVQFHFFPPSIELENLQIAAKDPSQFGFEILEIDSVEADLDFLQLLGGRIGVSTLEIKGTELDLNLDLIRAETGKTSAGINLSPIFDSLKYIPIHRLALKDVAGTVSSKINKINVTFNESHLLIINDRDSLNIEADLDSESFQFEELNDSAHISMSAMVDRKSIDLKYFHLTTLNTELQLKGVATHFDDFRKNLSAKIKLSLSTDASLLASKLKSQLKLPAISGIVNLTGDLDIDKTKIQGGQLNLKAQKVKVDSLDIGQIEILGPWKDNKFHAELFQITNESSLIDLSQFELDLAWKENTPELRFKTKIGTEMLDLSQLLENLGVSQVPIELMAAGNLQCGGPLYPDFLVNCQGEIHSDLFEARTSYENGNVVVQVGELGVTGNVNIDKEKVSYKADVKLGNNQAHSEGKISYRDGFDISYESPEIDFKDLDNLANLSLEGKARLAGRTSGDSHHAIFYIDLEGQNIWFENYFLGHPKLTLRYKSGILNFENITSYINSSRLKAQVELDLNENQISIEGEGLGLDVSDALLAFQRKLSLPIELSGTGDIKLKAWGPLDFPHLSYDFSAQLQKSTIAGESFDSGVFKVHSLGGEVKLEELILKKGAGQILGQGVAHPDGTTQLDLSTQSMAIEDSENVARLSPNISGQWNANLRMTGRILKPDIKLDAEIKTLAIEDQEFAPSQAHLNFNSHGMSGTANLFEGKLVSNFILPFSDQDPFKLEASARNWNFTTIFTLIGGAPLLSEYQASLTGDLKLEAEKGGFFASSGEGSILKAELQRKNLHLINPGPMELKMENGRLTLKNFRLAGDNSYIEASTNGTTRQNLNLKLRSNIQLHIAQIFLPFMEDLSGVANIQANITGSLEKPEILGTGKLENGFAKIKALPHGFEKLSASAQFSQTKIIISDVSGGFAGGNLGGEGTISIQGLRDIPLLFKGHFENVSLNIPENVKTNGSGEITISGNWFPFTLSGIYRVTGGLITKDFTDSVNIQGAKQSSYLPKILLQNAFEPVSLNLKIIMEQPLRIKDALMDGNLIGNIGVLGSPSSPILSGKINIEHGSKIAFRDKSFEVASGNIIFNNPKELNPELFITAQAHVTDYDVNLTVQGNAKSPLIRLDSLPPLPYQDIVSLLALGITSGSLDDNGANQRRDSQQLATQAMAAGINEISKGAQKAWDVNVQVTSQYDDAKNMAIQKYTISRKLSDKLTLFGTQTTGDLESQNVQLKYNLNSNYSLSTSYEKIESAQSGTSSAMEPTGQVLGIDLEFKQEFR